ncbi:protein of unknown function [Pseudomonas sp. JV241A]|nr:protein of unknown function [Pseudomonas sp. JV241A]
MRWRRVLLVLSLRRWPACKRPRHVKARGSAPGFFMVLHAILGTMILGLGWGGMLRLLAYPFIVAPLLAPSAFTAGPFCLGKRNQNRSLQHTALRCAPGSFATVPSRGIAAYDLLRQVYVSRLRPGPKGATHQPPPDTYAQPPEVAKLRGACTGVSAKADVGEAMLTQERDKPAGKTSTNLLGLDLDVHARTSRRRERRLQEAERRCRSEGTRSAA